MLIDLHAHSAGISLCCKANARGVIEAAKAAGLDGLVLTNHYHQGYMREGELPCEFAKRFLEEYHKAQEIAAALDMRLFFGIEVTVLPCNALHFLVYGVDEDFVTAHPTMFDYPLEKLYAVVHKAGGILVQAHPMRNENNLQTLSLMDGVEISCHPKYDGMHLTELAEIAAREGKLLTCGGDYHADTPYRPYCGVYLPDDIADIKGIVAYLQSAAEMRLAAQETDGSAPITARFSRGKGLLVEGEVRR